MSHEELPSAVLTELDRRGLNGVPVLLVASTDLSLAGVAGQHWIVATRENVAAVAGGTSPTVESHARVREVEEFRTQAAMGSGFLQMYVDEHWVDLRDSPMRKPSDWLGLHGGWKNFAQRAR